MQLFKKRCIAIYLLFIKLYPKYKHIIYCCSAFLSNFKLANFMSFDVWKIQTECNFSNWISEPCKLHEPLLPKIVFRTQLEYSHIMLMSICHILMCKLLVWIFWVWNHYTKHERKCVINEIVEISNKPALHCICYKKNNI